MTQAPHNTYHANEFTTLSLNPPDSKAKSSYDINVEFFDKNMESNLYKVHLYQGNRIFDIKEALATLTKEKASEMILCFEGKILDDNTIIKDDLLYKIRNVFNLMTIYLRVS